MALTVGCSFGDYGFWHHRIAESFPAVVSRSVSWFTGFIYKMVEDVAGKDRGWIFSLYHDAIYVYPVRQLFGAVADVLYHHIAYRGDGRGDGGWQYFWR